MEVLNNYQRKKLDETNDEEFYSDPKFVYHLDANFRNNLSNVYKNEITDNSTVQSPGLSMEKSCDGL